MNINIAKYSFHTPRKNVQMETNIIKKKHDSKNIQYLLFAKHDLKKIIKKTDRQTQTHANIQQTC